MPLPVTVMAFLSAMTEVIYIWKRLSAADVERIIRDCNLDEYEQKLLRLLRTGRSNVSIGIELGYCDLQITRHKKKLLDKIGKDLL